GGVTWTATLTPTANIEDTTNLITLANTGVADAAGNTGLGTTDSNNYAIDTKHPTATVGVDDSAPEARESSLVTISFSEAVFCFDNGDLSDANSIPTRRASDLGGVTWTATLTPTANIEDTTNLITLANTGVADAAGNTGLGTTDSNNYAIDTINPTVAVDIIATSLSDGTPSSNVTFTFSEDPGTSFTVGDVTPTNGSISGFTKDDATHYHAT